MLNLSSPSTQSSSGIHGNESYINFKFSVFTLPMFFLLLPLLYMPVTLIIILRICVKLRLAMKEKYVNVNLFLVITISIITCLLFFLLDIFFLRLPATGVFTSWCASVQPNRYLNALYVITMYVNYNTMIFPFLVSLMRLILIQFPQNHNKINEQLLKVALPLIFLYPSLFTFFMIPSTGYCFQPGSPYQFGEILIMFQDTWFGLRNNYFLFGNTALWMSASVVNNLLFFVKLVILKSSLNSQRRSRKSYRAEFSLTLTTFSMLFSYLSNMMRPFGNDLDTCIVAWVFYITHPVFRRNRVNKVMIPTPMRMNC